MNLFISAYLTVSCLYANNKMMEVGGVLCCVINIMSLAIKSGLSAALLGLEKPSLHKRLSRQLLLLVTIDSAADFGFYIHTYMDSFSLHFWPLLNSLSA